MYTIKNAYNIDYIYERIYVHIEWLGEKEGKFIMLSDPYDFVLMNLHFLFSFLFMCDLLGHLECSSWFETTIWQVRELILNITTTWLKRKEIKIRIFCCPLDRLWTFGIVAVFVSVAVLMYRILHFVYISFSLWREKWRYLVFVWSHFDQKFVCCIWYYHQ